MSLRILYKDNKLKEGQYQQQEDPVPESNGSGWPKNTWFQKRLLYVREQQRKKVIETEFVYEIPLGTVTFRQPNGADSKTAETRHVESDGGLTFGRNKT